MLRFISGGASLHLVLMNYYMHTGESENALAAAHSLLKELGPDAWIETQISVIYKNDGQLDPARATIDRACNIEPDLVTPHITRAEIAAAQMDFEAAVESLRLSESIRPFV